jgi:hypothetical protein
VRDVYGPLCLGHQQLSREMVGLELNASRGPVLKPNRSYSNYGGVSAKAEYSHDVVSWRTRPYVRVMMGFFLGSPASPPHHLNVRRSLWPIYSTTSVPINRFLCAAVCESADRAH